MSDSKEKQFALRLPADLYAEIEGWARDELRSANAQILVILREAVAERKRKQAGGKGVDRGSTMESDSKSHSRAAA